MVKNFILNFNHNKEAKHCENHSALKEKVLICGDIVVMISLVYVVAVIPERSANGLE